MFAKFQVCLGLHNSFRAEIFESWCSGVNLWYELYLANFVLITSVVPELGLIYRQAGRDLYIYAHINIPTTDLIIIYFRSTNLFETKAQSKNSNLHKRPNKAMKEILLGWPISRVLRTKEREQRRFRSYL